jgi:hypothetical protein
MYQYKTCNVHSGNNIDKYIGESKINEMAADGWRLIQIIQPPNSTNNRWVTGVFEKEGMPAVGRAPDIADKPPEPKDAPGIPMVSAEEQTYPKKRLGRPPKVSE